MAGVRPLNVRLGQLAAELPSLRTVLADGTAEAARAAEPLTTA
jgi:hypothetical protein